MFPAVTDRSMAPTRCSYPRQYPDLTGLDAVPPARPAAFHVMAKPIGALCNLDCGYCFYLRKESLYPDDRGRTWRMSDAVLESYIRQFLAAQQVPEANFAWQGGEPTLLGLDFFRRVVELQRQYRPKGMVVHNAFQTNATLLDDEWCEFLREHRFLIGVSIDGPRELHDHYRVNKGGQGTFDAVRRGLERLRQHGVEHNLLCVVNALNGDRPLDVYRFFRDELDETYYQFIPAVEGTPDGAVTDWSVGPEQYGRFLCAVFDEWVRHDVGRRYVQAFDVALQAWCGQEPGLCVYARTCGTAMALEHNGDLYSCDHFVTPHNRLGNLIEEPLVELVSRPFQHKFGLDKREMLTTTCRECPALFACNGGCPKDRFVDSPTGEAGHNYLCAGLKRFFEHIDPAMRYMAGELRQRRAPANVMGWLQRREARVDSQGGSMLDSAPARSGGSHGSSTRHRHRDQRR